MFDSILDTNSPLLDDNKMADEDEILLTIFSLGRQPCAYASAYVDPVLTGQCSDVSVSTRRTDMLLVLMSLMFSLAYAYVLVKTSLNVLNLTPGNCRKCRFLR